MKVLSRDFSTKEKVLLLILVLFLVAVAYYYFFLVPTNNAIDKAKAETNALDDEYIIVEAKIAQLQKMQNELDELIAQGKMKIMPSYNNGKEVRKFLNNILGDLDYSINFIKPMGQDGDQIRRKLTLQFSANDYDTIRRVLSELVNGDMRCMIADVNCAYTYRSYTWDGLVTYEDKYTVTASVTFYETMVGGSPDADLPESGSAVH